MRALALAMIALPLAGCGVSFGDDAPGITGSGTGGTRSYAASGFTGVQLAGSDDVDVTVGSGFAVTAQGASADLDRLRIRVKGDRLAVDRRGEGLSDGRPVLVHVTLPRLEAADVAGSGTLSVARVGGDAFAGRIAGSGDLRLGAVAVKTAEFKVAGSGTVHAAGSTETLRVKMAGSGAVDAKELRATSAEISMAGSGDVRAAVSGPATVKIVGSGDVDLGPQARCTTKNRGSGTVRCG